MLDLPNLEDVQTDVELKTCCAAVYESQWAQLLLGDSFHPGGLALTRRIGELLQLGPDDRVLDVASGQGTSALFLAETFGCDVVGVDYGRIATQQANQAAVKVGLAHKVHFEYGDAECLPFDDASFDAIICECAFCTFPDKPTAAAEVARVLKDNGRVALSDLTRTRNGPLPPELETLIAWIACIADAQPLEKYTAYLETVGLTVTQVESHDTALVELIRDVRGKLLAAELMVKLGKIDFPTADFSQAKKIARTAAESVRQGKLGYAILVASGK
ncbi:MAG: methyltransferase domain-containing protein [Chloroflexi bacterium]|nr:methyltransferase domain-containing protein [Chloroflexota bacterium]